MDNKIEITTIDNLDSEIRAPPSKAHTLRALFIAALAKGESILHEPLIAEDQKYAIKALKELGVRIQINDNQIRIEGSSGNLTAPKEEIFIGNSGVTARILTVLGSLADEDIIFTGTERMQTGRPLTDLMDAIKEIGIDARSLNGNGCPPVRIKGKSLEGGSTELKGNKSSQYFSAILLCAPYAKKEISIVADGKIVSKPYIDITIEMMKDFGVDVINEDYEIFTVPCGQIYGGREYKIEGDYSSASFFFAAAAITGGKIRVTNLNPESKQGDKAFVGFLKEMGCIVKFGEDFVEVEGRKLKGIKADMEDYPDIVIPLAVVSAFAEGKSEFYNISHLKYKECDRLKAPVTELRKMNINAEANEDGIIVEGGHPLGSEIETYKDHRMAMSFAVAGLKVPGITILNPENTEKSFPDFFEVLKRLK